MSAAKQKGLLISDPTEFSYTPGKGIQGIVDGKRVAVGNATLMFEVGAFSRMQTERIARRRTKPARVDGWLLGRGTRPPAAMRLLPRALASAPR